MNLTPVDAKSWPKNFNITLNDEKDGELLIQNLKYVLNLTMAKSRTKEFGFITLFSDSRGTYWFKVSRGFVTALNESLAALENLVDDAGQILNAVQKEKVNMLYRMLNSLYE